MKRNILYVTVINLMIPFCFGSAQDKKSEQKIKIVVNDGSSSKVIMDTVFINTHGPDSLNLKDGTVVYLKHPDSESGYRNHKGKDHYSVTYSSDGKDDGKEYKEVTVISSDSAISNSSSDREHKKYKIITKNSKDSGDTFEEFVNKSDNDSTINRTKYVIAKDGMVVTVEGNDEARTRELVKEIKNKLGVNNENNKK